MARHAQIRPGHGRGAASAGAAVPGSAIVRRLVLLTALAPLALPAPAASPDEAAQLFDWAERTYPQFFSPAGSPTRVLDGGVHYRSYADTGLLLGVRDDDVLAYGDSIGLVSLGPLAPYLVLAGSGGVSAGAVRITAGPEGVTTDAASRFEFDADGAASYRCALDGAAPEPCSSPHLVHSLGVGSHHLMVEAVAADGEAGPAIRHDWTVASLFATPDATGHHADLIATTVQPDTVTDNSWRGIFRINCDFAHSSYDDPIVFPGQDDAAHLHRFYGNLLTDAHTTLASLLTEGESSCQGNVLNRSAYWVPALLAPAWDAVTGARLLDAEGAPAWTVVPAVVGNDDEAHEIFYYSAGIDDLDAIQPIPTGLKMIAGDHMAGPGREQSTAVVRWHCQSWQSDEITNPRWSTTIPECIAPDRVRMDVFFPSCWNGVDLDAPDHKSHLAYPVNLGGPAGTVCPDTHPVPILRVSFHYAYGVKPEAYDPATRSSRGWRLASDRYEVTGLDAGGLSLHADWFNAWHPEALQAVLDHCIRRRLDCHDGNLANGFRLSGTREGSQVTPAVINDGLGN